MLALAAVATALVSGTGPLPAGATDLTVLAGRPFYSVRVAHGITDRFDLGLGVDVSPVAGLFRPLAQMRLRLWNNEVVQVALRGLVASVMAPQAEVEEEPTPARATHRIPQSTVDSKRVMENLFPATGPAAVTPISRAACDRC